MLKGYMKNLILCILQIFYNEKGITFTIRKKQPKHTEMLERWPKETDGHEGQRPNTLTVTTAEELPAELVNIS